MGESGRERDDGFPLVELQERHKDAGGPHGHSVERFYVLDAHHDVFVEARVDLSAHSAAEVRFPLLDLGDFEPGSDRQI